MNGIYDMGGMTCFGVIEREENEPVFHSDWERRVFAMNIASLAFLGPVDRARSPPALSTRKGRSPWMRQSRFPAE